jgi:hypothetical protein
VIELEMPASRQLITNSCILIGAAGIVLGGIARYISVNYGKPAEIESIVDSAGGFGIFFHRHCSNPFRNFRTLGL